MDHPQQTRLEDLKAAAYNPRRITKKQKKMLAQSLAEFGDLGGIIYNRASKNLVGGTQRVAAMRADPRAKLTLVREMAEPSANGTVADGYVTFGGERYSYREVCWPDDKERLANLSANKGAGSFDTALLADTLQALSGSSLDLTLSMFDEQELRAYLPDVSALDGPVAPAPPSSPPSEGPERLRAPTPAQDAPHATLNEAPSMKQVTLTYREADHAKFCQLVDALKDIFHVSNVSDVVLQALTRTGITAAFKP